MLSLYGIPAGGLGAAPGSQAAGPGLCCQAGCGACGCWGDAAGSVATPTLLNLCRRAGRGVTRTDFLLPLALGLEKAGKGRCSPEREGMLVPRVGI